MSFIRYWANYKLHYYNIWWGQQIIVVSLPIEAYLKHNIFILIDFLSYIDTVHQNRKNDTFWYYLYIITVFKMTIQYLFIVMRITTVISVIRFTLTHNAKITTPIFERILIMMMIILHVYYSCLNFNYSFLI